MTITAHEQLPHLGHRPGVPTVVLLEGVGRRYQIGTDVVDAMQDIDLEIDGASSPSCSVRRGAASRRC